MTIAEMFALPVGQRIVWTPDPWWQPEEGEVGGTGADGLVIVWPDGERFVIAPSDGNVAEFAANLEALSEADESVVINRPAAPGAGCSPRASAPPD